MPAEENIVDLRQEIDRLISSGQSDVAAARLRELWRKESGSAAAAFLGSRLEKLRGKLSLTGYRVAILRSFTVEPVVPLLQAEAFVYGIDLKAEVGDFNAYAQEILDEKSRLYDFNPDGVILAVRTADVAPDLWQDFRNLRADGARAVVERVRQSFQQWIGALRAHSRASLIVHNLERPIRPSFGILDAQSSPSQSEGIQEINHALRQIASQHRGVYVLDYDALMSRHGRLRWQDERKWLMARMPIAADQLIHLSREWLRFLVPLSGKAAKALVVDLDNTLWGGVIGEDGMAGIKLGAEYPGASYQALQRTLLDLAHRGILLAVCSKNNPEDAMEALEKHPGMLLKPTDFAALRINWNDKAQGLREIASELNLGVDALAFLDDNPFEREQVRSSLPEVAVIDLPPDASHYAAAVRDCPLFERLAVSREDEQRTALYAEQRQRAQAEQSFQSKEDFYRFLAQEAEITAVLPATLARISQLTQKTNQFNLTTRRYAEQQIQEMALRSEWQVLSIRVRDRFGDHGLVGVAITRDDKEECEIDTFLLSCRVIGRTVETALLSHLAERATRRGCRRLTGWFLPTKKNAPARDFYAQHGFEVETNNGAGSRWVLDLSQRQIPCPEWIKLTVTKGEDH